MNQDLTWFMKHVRSVFTAETETLSFKSKQKNHRKWLIIDFDFLNSGHQFSFSSCWTKNFFLSYQTSCLFWNGSNWTCLCRRSATRRSWNWPTARWAGWRWSGRSFPCGGTAAVAASDRTTGSPPCCVIPRKDTCRTWRYTDHKLRCLVPRSHDPSSYRKITFCFK